MPSSPATRSAPRSPHHVRRFILITVACTLGTVLGLVSGADLISHPVAAVPQDCQHAAEAANPVRAENTCHGTSTWRPDRTLGADNAIEAFASPASVNVGSQVKLFTSTTAATYTFSIYRMGWYQGTGGRLMSTSPTEQGIAQPAPTIDTITHMVSCDTWTHPVTIMIPTTWVSGFYIVKLLSSDGDIRYTPLIVRSDASHAPILYTASILTYQAYNRWGGYNLYRGLDAQGQSMSDQRSFVTSFDRPYEGDFGLQDYVDYESGLISWFERQGYNMTYSTDMDTDLDGSHLLNHKLLIVGGHDEYWSTQMREHVTAARDAGVSLGFFGANDVYWHIRLQPSALGPDREVVCYKPYYYYDGARTTNDPMAEVAPAEDTVEWADPPLNDPQDSLLGEEYRGGVTASVPMVLGATQFLQKTGLRVGSSIPGIMGGEYDRVVNNGATPLGVTILSTSLVECVPATNCPSTRRDTANSTIYTASSGARVFDAGTFLWGLALGPVWNAGDAQYTNAGFQRYTANIVSWLLHK